MKGRKILTLAARFAVASVLTLGVAACGNDSTSTATTQGAVTIVKAPSGTVTGVVQDTNGNPLADIRVGLAGKETVTDWSGTYVFENVVATNVTPMDAASTGVADVAQQGLQIVISNTKKVTDAATQVVTWPASGYLGATVTVRPQAQWDNTSNAQDAQTSSIFIDGFNVSAGTAVLPKLGASMTGTLRDAQSGNPLSGVALELDMASVGATLQQQPQNGVFTSYATSNFDQTSANGVFTFTNLPEDTNFNLISSGYFLDGDADGVLDAAETTILASANTVAPSVATTSSSSTPVLLGQIMVSKIPDADTIGPQILSVDNTGGATPALASVAAPTAYAFLDNTSQVVIRFTEPVKTAEVVSTSVQVWDVTNKAYLTATPAISDDGLTLTVTLTKADGSALDAGTQMQVSLLTADFQDSDGNFLTIDDDGSRYSPSVIAAGLNAVNNVDDGLAFVEKKAANTGYGTYFVQANLQLYQTANRTAATISEPTQLTVDSGTNSANEMEDAVMSALQSYSGAFNDVVDYDGTISSTINQLNSQEVDNTAAPLTTSMTRLKALGDALLGNFDPAGDAVAITNTARIQFTVTAAAGQPATAALNFTLDVASANGTPKAFTPTYSGIDTSTVLPAFANPSTAVAAAAQSTFIAQNGDTVEVILETVTPGDVVTITPLDDLGNPGIPKTITLADNVKPTTVLQHAYRSVGSDAVGSDGLWVGYGTGGELVVTRNPYPQLNITPRLLVNPDQNGNAGFTSMVIENLTAVSTLDAAIAGLYDAAGYTAWTADTTNLTRNIGVAFSEDVAMVAGQTVEVLAVAADRSRSTDAAGTALLTNPVAMNNVVTQDDVQLESNENLTEYDLVRLTVSDVKSLANDHTGKIIDFEGAVTDTASAMVSTKANNIADAGAKVVIRDVIPPFVTSAVHNGDTMVITFDTPVTVAAGSQVTLGGLNQIITLDAAANNNWSYASATNTLTINLALYGAVDRNATFSLNDATIITGATTVVNTANTLLGQLDWSTIADANTNTWAAQASDSLPATTPTFAMLDNTPAFTITAPGVTGSLAGSVVVTYTFSHRLSAGSIAALEIPGNYSVAPTTANVNDENSGTGTILTLTFAAGTGAGAVTLTSALSPVSAWFSDVTLAMPDVTITAP